VISPVTRLCCHRRERIVPAHLTPTLGRQDHTTSPSAICCSSDNTPRPSHPAPNVRDDREAPLFIGCGTRGRMVLICPTAQEKMCTTGSLRMAGMQSLATVIAVQVQLRGATRRSNPACRRGDSLDCFACARDDGGNIWVVITGATPPGSREARSDDRLQPRARNDDGEAAPQWDAGQASSKATHRIVP